MNLIHSHSSIRASEMDLYFLRNCNSFVIQTINQVKQTTQEKNRKNLERMSKEVITGC